MYQNRINEDCYLNILQFWSTQISIATQNLHKQLFEKLKIIELICLFPQLFLQPFLGKFLQLSDLIYSGQVSFSLESHFSSCVHNLQFYLAV
jgi:hypothetical protein